MTIHTSADFTVLNTDPLFTQAQHLNTVLFFVYFNRLDIPDKQKVKVKPGEALRVPGG
jgi:hypothetical protein